MADGRLNLDADWLAARHAAASLDRRHRVVAAAFIVAIARACSCDAAMEGGFRVTRSISRAFVNPDASLGMTHDLVLHVPRGAAPVTMLRFPTPHQRFALNDVKASLDGRAIDDVRLPLYGDPGFEVWLGHEPIAAGQRAALHVEYTVLDEITAVRGITDTARVEWSLLGFAGQEAAATDTSQTLVLLPGLREGEVRLEPTGAARFGEWIGRPAITWHWPAGPPPGVTALRASFPRRGMTRLATRSWWSVAAHWLADQLWARAVLVAISVALFGAAYFGFSGGRHVVAFLVIGATLGALLLQSPAAQLLLLPVLIVAAGGAQWRRWRRRDQAASAVAAAPNAIVHVDPVSSVAVDDDAECGVFEGDDDADDEDVEIEVDTSLDEPTSQGTNPGPWRNDESRSDSLDREADRTDLRG